MKKNLKSFALSLLATTVSIGLTFGIAAIIDHNKSKKEKRDIVMMVMYDMYNSLKAVEEADSNLHKLMELQLQIAEDTSSLQDNYVLMVMDLPVIEYTETIERIFSSNIETINTIGNVFFTEKVAEFYYIRQYYKQNISDSVYNKITQKKALPSLEEFLGFSYYPYAVMSTSLMWDMRCLFGLCQQMMNVSDKEIEAYIKKREKIEEGMSDTQESKLSAMKELSNLSTKINTARDSILPADRRQ